MSADNLESSQRLYQILCVEDFASQDEVKRAYKQLALKYHPDKNLNDPSCVDKFREVRVAYEVLSNKDRKRKYDIALKVHKASTGQYGQASALGKARPTSGLSSSYTSANINAKIYEELSRQQQRRTARGGSAGAATQPRTASTNRGVSSPMGTSGTSYTQEQQDEFRRRERERQAELKKQLERERTEAREREREAKRREQERQEEILQQRWQQQQAAHTAAAAARNAAKRGGSVTSGLASPRPKGTTADSSTGGGNGGAPRSQQQQQQQQQHSFRNSPLLSRHSTPVGQRSGSAVRRGGPGVSGSSNTPRYRGASAHGTGLSFQSFDGTPFMKGRSPRMRTGSPTPSMSTASGTPPPPVDLRGHAPRHSPAFPVDSSTGPAGAGYATEKKGPPRRRGDPVTDDANGGRASDGRRASAMWGRESSVASSRSAPFSPNGLRRTVSRTDKTGNEDGGGGGSTAKGGSTPSKGARTAAALHTARDSAAAQRERLRQRDLRTQEQEQELQRIIRARKQLEKDRQKEEEALFRADPVRYYQQLLDFCAVDETSEREQLIIREEALARRRITRSRSVDLDELLYLPSLRLLLAQEEDHRAFVAETEHLCSKVASCGLAEIRNRLSLTALEKRSRKQLVGREANELYFVQRCGRLKSTLVGQEAVRRQALEREALFRRQYLGAVTGPEFFGRMHITEEERAARKELTRSHFPGYPSAMNSPIHTLGGRSDVWAGEELFSRTSTTARLDGSAPSPTRTTFGGSGENGARVCTPRHTGVRTPQGSADTTAGTRSGSSGSALEADRKDVLLPFFVAQLLVKDETRSRADLAKSEEAEVISLLKARANKRHDCYEKQTAAAVASALRQAAKETAFHKRRVAELEQELLAHARSEEQRRGTSGGGGVHAPASPMRVCTPSSLEGSPPESDSWPEVPEACRAYRGEASRGSGSFSAAPLLAPTANRVGDAGNTRVSTAANTSERWGGGVVDGHAEAAAAAAAQRRRSKPNGETPEAVSGINGGAMVDTSETPRRPSTSSGSTALPPPFGASTSGNGVSYTSTGRASGDVDGRGKANPRGSAEPRGSGGLDFGRYFPRWRDTPGDGLGRLQQGGE